MSSYDDEKTNLKSIFGDNKYPTGGNFAELINLPDFKLTENNDGTITVNNVTYDMTKSDLGSIAQISEDFNNLPNGLTFVSVSQNNAPEPTHAYWVRTFITSAYNGRKLQVAQADSSNNRYIRTYSGIWNNWDSLATGSELNNKVMDVNAELNNKVTDNKDGTIKVNGSSITPADNNTVNNELNYKVTDNNNGSITVNGATFIPADNSKVAKLSGDNNFDTVPEVDNNPLLLASSLPSDLARTSQQTNFTAGLQSGGVSVATSDDLKSVENLAWREITSSEFEGGYLFRDNQDGTATLSGTIHYTAPTQTYIGFPDFVIHLPDGYLAKSDVYNWFQVYTTMHIRDTQGHESTVQTYYSGSAVHIYAYSNILVKDAIISLRSPIIQIFNNSSYTASQKVGSIDGFTINVSKA